MVDQPIFERIINILLFGLFCLAYGKSQRTWSMLFYFLKMEKRNALQNLKIFWCFGNKFTEESTLGYLLIYIKMLIKVFSIGWVGLVKLLLIKKDVIIGSKELQCCFTFAKEKKNVHSLQAGL